MSSPHTRKRESVLSIHQLARLHCNERLLVAPLCWTSRHLDLLRCHFATPVPAEAVARFDSEYPEDDALEFSFERPVTRFWRMAAVRDKVITTLVAGKECPLESGGTLSFFFDHARHCIRLECVALYDRCNDDSDDKLAQCRAPIAAYVNCGLVQEARRRSLYPESHLLGDRVTMGVFRRKLKAITPADDRFDPYIVAILIATAQEQQKASLEVPSGDTTFTPRVLSSSKDQECMCLYSADIDSTFLAEPDSPAVAPKSQPSMTIQVTSIAFKPYPSLRNRLLAALLPPSFRGLDPKQGVATLG